MKVAEQFEQERAIEELNNPKPKCRIWGCSNDCMAFNDRLCYAHTSKNTHNSQTKLTCPHCSSTNILLDARTGAVCGDCGKKYCNVKSSCCGAEKIVNPQNGWNECSECFDPFVPASEKEYIHKYNHNAECVYCDAKVSQPSPDWMEEERKAFYEWYVDKDDWYKLIADYWLSRIAETREAARKEGYEIATRNLKNKYDYAHRANIEGKIAREQGRQEERERVVKMIEEKARHWHAKFTKKEYLKILEWANELLANLKENE